MDEALEDHDTRDLHEAETLATQKVAQGVCPWAVAVPTDGLCCMVRVLVVSVARRVDERHIRRHCPFVHGGLRYETAK